MALRLALLAREEELKEQAETNKRENERRGKAAHAQ